MGSRLLIFYLTIALISPAHTMSAAASSPGIADTTTMVRKYSWDTLRVPEEIIKGLLRRSTDAAWSPLRLRCSKDGIAIKQIELSHEELEHDLKKYVNSPGQLFVRVDPMMDEVRGDPTSKAFLYVRAPIQRPSRLDFTMAVLAVWGSAAKRKAGDAGQGRSAKKRRLNITTID